MTVAELEVDHLEKQLRSADNKVIEIESENETIKLQTEKLQQQNKVYLYPHKTLYSITLIAFVQFCSKLHHTLNIRQRMFDRKYGLKDQYYKSYATL